VCEREEKKGGNRVLTGVGGWVLSVSRPVVGTGKG
jgi:hypothetical protein